MIDDVPAIIPPAVAAEAVTTSPAHSLPEESAMPAPTAEQARAADQVFTAPTPRHPVATLLGVATSAMLLRDLAVDMFATTEAEEEAEEKPDEDKPG
jgi:hypothetical protein